MGQVTRDRSAATGRPGGESPESGPVRVVVMATVVVPGDAGMPLEVLEAYVAQAFRDGGVHPVWVDCDFVDEVDRG